MSTNSTTPALLFHLAALPEKCKRPTQDLSDVAGSFHDPGTCADVVLEIAGIGRYVIRNGKTGVRRALHNETR